MTINDLIQRLEDYRDDYGEDAEVRLVTDQGEPIEFEIHNVVSGEEINACEGEQDQDAESDDVIYVVGGEILGLGSKRAWAMPDRLTE